MELDKIKAETGNAKLLYKDQSESNEKNLQNPVSTTERQIAVMRLLWKRMRESFGQSWVREYGDVNGEAIHTWMGGLAQFSEQQIARGVKSAMEWTDTFPPTLPQFKKMCLTVRPEERKNVTEQRIEREAKQGKPDSVIEHLARNATSPIAKRELERMRRIVAGEDVETKEQSYHILGLSRRWGRLNDSTKPKEQPE